MINKKNMWFLTLFSLILVLSVYYITMPTELLIDTGSVEATTSKVEETSESATLVALRVEKEEKSLNELTSLKDILMNSSSTVEEKNDAYEKMKNINLVKGEEEQLEQSIKNDYNLNSVVTVSGDQINIVASTSNHSVELANKIMRSIQGNYDSKMYITVKFEE